MDSPGRGGGKTPRGRKSRGSRGRGKDSSSGRTSSAASSSSVSQNYQSPTVSSTTSSPSTREVSDEQSKVSALNSSTQQELIPSLVSRLSSGNMSSEIKGLPETPEAEDKPTEELQSDYSIPTEVTEPEKKQHEEIDESESDKVADKTDDKEKSVETENEETESTRDANLQKLSEETSPTHEPATEPEAPPANPEASQSKDSAASEVSARKTSPQDLEPPEIPQDFSTSESAATTESKIEEAFSKSHQPRATAKTLVVTPTKDAERSTTAPLTVEIDDTLCIIPAPDDGEGRPFRRQLSRSASVSPYAHALHSPVGIAGYIGGVGFSEEDIDSGGSTRLSRRESALATMETAVRGFNNRQWILLFIFGMIDLLASITISLQAPFFPKEAELKGASATEYGLVFGSFEFIVFITSPLFGKYMNKLGPKTVFNVGLFTTSVAVICFGLLDRINDHTLFITLCFVCRIFEALGCSGFFTATFTIIACEFPDSVATTFASLETFFGLGMIIGPTVGGLLYGIGGFPLPFFTVGAALFVGGILSSFVMPKIDKATDDDGTEQAGFGIWTILKIPTIAIAALSVATTSMSLGFVSATLEPHIRRFNLTPLQTGLVFIVNGGVYAMSAPFFGYVCDGLSQPMHIAILGNVFIFIGFLFIGPAAFLPLDTILWVTIVGLIIEGLGLACCLVSGFIVSLRESMRHGLPDNMNTYGVSSGLWQSMVSLGACIGPTASGALYDHVGFRNGSYLILASSLIVGLIIFIHSCCLSPHISASRDLESQPLIRPISPLGGKKSVEASTPAKPSSSAYGSTS